MERNAVYSRSRDIAFVGLFIALIAVSAWVTVPIGPIPVTLQMFAIPLAICVLRPALATSAIYGYILLGAVGVPVFSGMRGGIGVLLGPTGGFLFGYLIAVPLACLLLYGARRAGLVRPASGKDPLAPKESLRVRVARLAVSSGMYLVSGIVFTVVSYAFGVAWFMNITGTPLEGALATCVLPFVIPDLIKVILAAGCANALAPFMQVQKVAIPA